MAEGYRQHAAQLRKWQRRRPARCPRLPEFMPTSVGLVSDAPLSGYVADLFLGLIAAYPTASIMPYIVHAAGVWVKAFGVDPEFWSERQFGHRICSWVDQVLGSDANALRDTLEIRDELLRYLDLMITSGVAQARDLEMRNPGRRASYPYALSCGRLGCGQASDLSRRSTGHADCSHCSLCGESGRYQR
jgi:hypothetical protein